MSKVVIAGCGYVGKKLASYVSEDNRDIVTITRSAESYHHLNKHYSAYQLDLDQDTSLPDIDLNEASIVYLIPPPAKGVHDTRIQRFLEGLDQSNLPARIILISTTGVYGNCDDNWVTESRVPTPDTDRGLRRLDAENRLIEFSTRHHVSYIILRVPGIYGPDKLPVQRILEKKPVLNLSESPWSNRIHVDDLVQACLQSIRYNGDFHVFNISDGNPSSMTDYFLRVARSRNLPEPPQISEQECEKIFTDNMMSYLRESKKIDNKLMLKELGVRLKYPTLEKGLKL